MRSEECGDSMVEVRVDTPEPNTIRVSAGPLSLPATPLEAARRHFLPGIFSHRQRDESVQLRDDLSAEIGYKIGWGPLSTRIRLLARLEIPTEAAAAAVSFESREGLVPFAGRWKFEQSPGGTCDLYLDQVMDTSRLPFFVPVGRILGSTIRRAFEEQLAAAECARGIRGSFESRAS